MSPMKMRKVLEMSGEGLTKLARLFINSHIVEVAEGEHLGFDKC